MAVPRYNKKKDECGDDQSKTKGMGIIIVVFEDDSVIENDKKQHC
jgi:hypothetical protein